MNLPRRDLVLVAVGALLGAAITAAGFLATDDEAPTAASTATDTTVTTIDITDTDFGELTEDAEASGIKIQWTAEVLSGAETGPVEFVSAHRDGDVAVIHGDARVVVKGEQAFACTPEGCRPGSAAEVGEALPPLVRPFFDVLRLATAAQESPDYRITGEGDFGGGVVARCGSYDPAAFDLKLPGEVREVRQCVSLETSVVVAIDLFGVDGSVAGGTANALADATDADFTTG